jgi:TM2 domain-containing membrane protein YozV
VNAYAAVYAPEFVYMQDMTDQQRMLFLSQYAMVRKDATTAILLAVFLGGFGAHRFYMGQVGLGVLYLLFCWTGIPSIISLIECFLLSGRVRMYNASQAAMLAAGIKMQFPAYGAGAPPQYAQPPATFSVTPR